MTTRARRGSTAERPEMFTPAVYPQVGAVLQLNTALVEPAEDDTIDNTHCLRGHKHWLLDGSCVLLGNDRVLAIRHTLLKRGKKAAFFPYEGFFLLGKGFERDYPYGDNVMLVSLKRSLRSTEPLPFAYGSKRWVLRAAVAGYGRWKEPAIEDSGRWKVRFTRIHGDGIQRRAFVKLGMPSDGPHDDNLDLNWWSPYNEGLVAHVNNSGGPLLWQEWPDPDLPIQVVGVTRETKENQQSCSRITRDRLRWLEDELPKSRSQEPATERLPPIHASIDKKRGWSNTLPVPDGGWKTVAVTLSATDGLRLQMGLLGAGNHESLAEVREDDRASGRFLYREWDLPKGAKEITIGVAPVAKSLQGDGDPESVEAQICCGFY